MTSQTTRNAVERAIDRMAEAFGSPGKAAVCAFLAALPSDAVIEWCEEEEHWAPVGLVAAQLTDELQHG